ncbi:DNA helicase [Tanacetum coccineum]
MAAAEAKRYRLNAYYKYQLHPRVNDYGLIFRGRRLFQQYVMAVYCTIEQSRMDFVRTHQNDIRCEYLPGLYDVVSRGYHDGIAVGSHIILPTSFTKGSRCMYMAQYPELTPADRADIVCIVFQQKVKDFLKFLIESEIFGDVTGESAVQILVVHLENMQRINYHGKEQLEAIINMPYRKKTTLVEWYEYNNANTDGRHLTYLNFPSEFCGTQKQRIGDQGKFKPRSPSKD